MSPRFEVIVRSKMPCLILLLAGLLYGPGTARCQEQKPERPQPDEQSLRIEREQAKARNKQRQADLARDTEKLLKLATELKEYVDKSNENTLSLDVIKKAEEIEKLAHSVREKMKGY
jgi:hypothetical protein